MNKLIGLEIFRFLCALCILIYHFNHFLYPNNTQYNYRIEQPFYNSLKVIFDNGDIAVNYFWAISGFVFFYKYFYKVYQEKITFNKFILLRFSRLYPLHFITLVFVIVLQYFYFNKNNEYFVYQFNDLYHFLLNLLLASHWGAQKGFSYNGPIWSVSVEILVYGLFFYLSKKNIFNTSSLLIIIIFSSLFKILKLDILLFNISIIDCIIFFFAGGLSAFMYEKHKNSILLKNISITILLTIIFLLIVSEKKPNHIFALLINLSLVIFGLFLLSKQPMFTINSKFCAALGNLSYSSYLTHFPIQLTIVNLAAFFNIKIQYLSYHFFFFYIVVTLVVSYYVYRLIELPCQNYIRNFLIQNG